VALAAVERPILLAKKTGTMTTHPQFFTRAEARDLDRVAIERLGIPSLVLMENAGRGAVEVLFSLGVRGPVVVCCGKGNNGGDGLVVARRLACFGVTPLVFLCADPKALSADAAAQWRIVEAMDLPRRVVADTPLDSVEVTAACARADWIVDALFGTGLASPLRPPFDDLVAAINASPARKIAIDLPSGLDADTGEPMGPTVRADHTVTFVAPKIGFRNPSAAVYLGRVHVVDIGVAHAFLTTES
jgi:NAD(P)H-hydrate epimerase